MNILALPTSISIGPLNITFYACCILLGALLSLVLSMWKMKRIGYDPKELENLFLAPLALKASLALRTCSFTSSSVGPSNTGVAVLMFK